MAHNEENLDERQEDEVEALKSIYDLGLWDILPSKIDLWRFDEILILRYLSHYFKNSKMRHLKKNRETNGSQ